MTPISPLVAAATPASASRPLRRRWATWAGLLLAGPLAGTASAATLVVTSGDVSQSTECHLVDAITAANTDTATGGCAAGSGADTIFIAPGVTTTLTQVNNSGISADDVARGLPIIRSTVRIDGNGNVIARSTAAGTPEFGLLSVASGGDLTVNGAVLTGVSSNGSGGAVYLVTGARVLLTASEVRGNVASIAGGGIASFGTLEIRDSVVSGNATNGASTVSSAGGGMAINGGTAALRNVTIANNIARSGGGLSISGATVSLNHVTITGNTANTSGGISLLGTVTLQNSIVAGNRAQTGSNEIPIGARSRFSSLGHNLIGDSSQTRSQAFDTATLLPSDRLATSDAGSNGTHVPTALGSIVQLGTDGAPVVTNNGGATPTVALVAGSPAINAADPLFTDSTPTSGSALRRDQRRYLLADGDTRRDIGAFEFPGLPPVAPAAPTALTATPGDGSLTIAFTPGEAGSSPISNYWVALGSSGLFIPLDPANGESPVTITGLTNGTPVTVRLKAISEDGASAASDPVTGTPAAVVNGTCGAASGTPTASAPVELLCSSGTASAVTGSDGAWRWSCTGSGGGTTATCAAPYAGQTITLTADPTTITVGDDGSTVFASSTSGAKPVLTSTTTSVCALSPFAGSLTGTTMTASGITAGTCTVKATLAGTGDVGEFRYLAASDQTVDITVNKGAQAITGFAADPSALKVGGMATLSATGGASGNAVTFSSLSGDICFVSGAMVTALSAGTCTVAADQAGNDGYAAAAQKTLAITVNKAAQLISGFSANPAALKVGGMAMLTASGGASGNPVTFRTTTTEVCSVSGAMVTALSAGTCALVASQAGTADFDAAADVTLNLPVNKAAQLISGFTANPTTIKVGETSTLSAFGGASGKPIVFASTTSDVCSVSGSTVTGLSAGHCALTANQADTADFDAAETALLAITIEAADVATGPALHLDMNDLDFGTGYLLRFRDVGVQTTSEPEIVTVSNPGTAVLSISSIVTTGDFRHTTSCGTTLAPGASCTISIRFSPMGVGTRNGETRITSNAVTSPDVIRLSGTGKGLQPAIKTNVSSFNFGRVKVGSVSRDQTLVITSTGTGPLEIRNIAVTGDYVGSHNCPRWLDAGKSCQVTGRFRPRATGVRAGTVSILSSVSNTPTQVSLSGTGF
ncbi:choice-of-anchor D domain-containing protein [Nevskia sp.]|uniref:choice-of-anchor D domain-containing protein n=1 Tax=Nevskia sp. TaxID=1929292 RepID=UPI003F70A287